MAQPVLKAMIRDVFDQNHGSGGRHFSHNKDAIKLQDFH
jgi:hypothetical protein